MFMSDVGKRYEGKKKDVAIMWLIGVEEIYRFEQIAEERERERVYVLMNLAVYVFENSYSAIYGQVH